MGRQEGRAPNRAVLVSLGGELTVVRASGAPVVPSVHGSFTSPFKEELEGRTYRFSLFRRSVGFCLSSQG